MCVCERENSAYEAENAHPLSPSRLMSLEVGGSVAGGDCTKCHVGGAADGRPAGSEMCERAGVNSRSFSSFFCSSFKRQKAEREKQVSEAAP